MSANHLRSARIFFIAFAAVALVIAGFLSYFADSDPDGLDSASLRGCEVVQTDSGEELTGQCIAQNAQEHPLSDTPLADYSIAGDDGLTGVAGVLGVASVFAIAGGLFWLLARSRRDAASPADSRE